MKQETAAVQGRGPRQSTTSTSQNDHKEQKVKQQNLQSELKGRNIIVVFKAVLAVFLFSVIRYNHQAQSIKITALASNTSPKNEYCHELLTQAVIPKRAFIAFL